MFKTIIFTLAIIFFMSGCKKDDTDDDVLSIAKTPYTGNQLRIDGYYYKAWEDMQFPMFFYRNGIIIDGGGYSNNEIPEREERYKNGQFYDKILNIKYSWGVFVIDSNKILFERWYPSERPYKAYVDSGIILNDTTFQITESYRMQDGVKTKIREENAIYHFKAFSPKPDSTNSFVK